jgi:hypothetical protein
MRHVLLPAAALLAACATPAPKPVIADAPARVSQGKLSAGAEGAFETGRLTATDQEVSGPFVLTYLGAGSELQVSTTAGGGQVLASVAGPIGQPFHVPPGASLRLPGPGEAVYAGYRPMPITRPLEAYVGRQIWIAVLGAQPEQWFLREISSDHVTIERSRTYRVLAIRRISEITWTDLTGADPTPRIVLAPQ